MKPGCCGGGKVKVGWEKLGFGIAVGCRVGGRRGFVVVGFVLYTDMRPVEAGERHVGCIPRLAVGARSPGLPPLGSWVAVVGRVVGSSRAAVLAKKNLADEERPRRC